MPTISGSTRAPEASASTSHSSRFGWTWTSSNTTSDGFRPSLVYASADRQRYTDPVSGYSITSRYSFSTSDSSGSSSTIRRAVPNTMRACSRSPAAEYTSPPAGPSTRPPSASSLPFVLLAFLRAIPTRACRCRYRPDGRRASRCPNIRRSHGRIRIRAPDGAAKESFVTRHTASAKSQYSSPSPRRTSAAGTFVSQRGGQPSTRPVRVAGAEFGERGDTLHLRHPQPGPGRRVEPQRRQGVYQG